MCWGDYPQKGSPDVDRCLDDSQADKTPEHLDKLVMLQHFRFERQRKFPQSRLDQVLKKPRVRLPPTASSQSAASFMPSHLGSWPPSQSHVQKSSVILHFWLHRIVQTMLNCNWIMAKALKQLWTISAPFCLLHLLCRSCNGLSVEAYAPVAWHNAGTRLDGKFPIFIQIVAFCFVLWTCSPPQRLSTFLPVLCNKLDMGGTSNPHSSPIVDRSFASSKDDL